MLTRFIRDEEGATVVEYAMIAILLAIVGTVIFVGVILPTIVVVSYVTG